MEHEVIEIPAIIIINIIYHMDRRALGEIQHLQGRGCWHLIEDGQGRPLTTGHERDLKMMMTECLLTFGRRVSRQKCNKYKGL